MGWINTSEKYPVTRDNDFRSESLFFVYKKKVYSGHYNPTAGTKALNSLDFCPNGCFYSSEPSSAKYFGWFPADEVEKWSYTLEEEVINDRRCICEINQVLWYGCKCGGN